MYRILVVFFLTVPVLEMSILIMVGNIVGALPTIFAVMFTAIVGAWLLRVQGFLTIRRVQERLAVGEIPDIEILEGALLIVGGSLLLTPGFVTDIIGFLLLIPVSRRGMCRFILDKGLLAASAGLRGGAMDPEAFYQQQQPKHKTETHTFEGEFRRED